MSKKKEKKYIIDNPALMAEWDWEKNKELGLNPNELTVGSGKKAWWKCSKGHEWQAVIGNRNKGNGCPYCTGRNAIKGENDLTAINPKLASEWNYEKNGDLSPEDFTISSGKIVWWKCNKGHEWQAKISHRNHGSGCPFCFGRNAIKGENDLQTINPFLAKEWNYEKNDGLTPMDVLPKSNKKVWWKCKKGHEWQAAISDRNIGGGCPICQSERHTSFPEYVIIYYLRKYCMDAIHLYNENGYELDIYIPSKKIAIEYDGNIWHKNRIQNELEKNLKCKNDSIKLYRIREGLPVLNDSSIDYVVDKNQKDLGKVLEKVLSEIVGFAIDIDLNRDAIAIENLREYTEKSNSLLFTNPTLAKEWNYEKNGSLRPEHILANSGKKAWWVCSKGHEWQARISHRNKGIGCPICSNKQVLKGYNDLTTTNPQLAKEWNYKKNGNLGPKNFTESSGEKVWWKCSKGHEWLAIIANRNKGRGCPICANKKIVLGYNDLATLNPTLAKEWNYEKNGDLRPEDFTANSNKKVWWKCAIGHEWQVTIYKKNKGSGCPYCTNKKVLIGYNDLATVNPKLASEWNCEKNGGLRPEHFTIGSDKKVWWKCEKSHEWKVTIDSRSKGNGCPYCSGRNAVQGKNDLATLNPKLASEWNYEKNGDLRPEDFTANSGKKVWWKCSNEHEWQATIANRNNGNGCPYCSGRYAVQGVNDLVTINPKLASEWNYKRNGGLKPEDFAAGSNKKVWWNCKKGHEWQATIINRNKGTACPECYKNSFKNKQK